MSESDAETAWAEVKRELDEWRAAGQRARLFLRDDDAVTDTPALQRLLGLIRRYEAPLLLAAIPAHAEDSLGAAAGSEKLVTCAVHGWAHRDHSPKGEKPAELGIHRPIDDVLEELRAGREKLAGLFGGRVSGLVVPPWNRIDDAVLARIGEIGFAGASVHGWLTERRPARMVNVHIDIIHWSGGRVGREIGWLYAELAWNMKEARRRGFRAVGILTHHLAHDEKAWANLETLMDRMSQNQAVWLAADDLLAEPDEPIPDVGNA